MTLSDDQSGVTIFELMVTLIVAAILLSIAVPSFSNLYDKNRVKGAAEEMSAQLQFARSEAIARNINVVVDVTGGANWCVGVDDTDAACDCTTDDDCQVNGVERVTDSSNFGGISLTSGDEIVTFEGTRGLPDAAASFDLASGDGRQIGLIMNGIGRTQLCSPAGSGNVWEYPECPSP